MIAIPDAPTFQFSQPHRGFSPRLNSDVHSLVTGLPIYVFPSAYRDTPEITLTLRGENAAIAQTLLGSIEHRGHSAREVIAAAGNAIAREICSQDAIAMFELCDSDRGPTLVSIDPYSVSQFRGVLFSRQRSKWQLPQKFALGRRFFILEFPNALGGRHAYRRALHQLSRLGPIFPRFKAEAEDFSPDPSLIGYRRDYIVYLTTATSNLGWYANGSYFEYCSEYYMLDRSLRAKRAKLVLRNHIVKGLNAFFERVGIQCVIEVAGGPSVEQCDAYSERLRNGDIETSELSNWIHGEV